MTPEELRAARKAMGLGQDALADALGVSGRSVRGWEAGRRGHAIPAWVGPRLHRLADARRRDRIRALNAATLGLRRVSAALRAAGANRAAGWAGRADKEAAALKDRLKGPGPGPL